jgi:hypothetical protein
MDTFKKTLIVCLGITIFFGAMLITGFGIFAGVVATIKTFTDNSRDNDVETITQQTSVLLKGREPSKIEIFYGFRFSHEQAEQICKGSFLLDYGTNCINDNEVIYHTVSEIVDAYSKSTILGEYKYQYKVVRVYGIIEKIGRNDANDVFVSLIDGAKERVILFLPASETFITAQLRSERWSSGKWQEFTLSGQNEQIINTPLIKGDLVQFICVGKHGFANELAQFHNCSIYQLLKEEKEYTYVYRIKNPNL